MTKTTNGQPSFFRSRPKISPPGQTSISSSQGVPSRSEVRAFAFVALFGAVLLMLGLALTSEPLMEAVDRLVKAVGR